MYRTANTNRGSRGFHLAVHDRQNYILNKRFIALVFNKHQKTGQEGYFTQPVFKILFLRKHGLLKTSSSLYFVFLVYLLSPQGTSKVSEPMVLHGSVKLINKHSVCAYVCFCYCALIISLIKLCGKSRV